MKLYTYRCPFPPCRIEYLSARKRSCNVCGRPIDKDDRVNEQTGRTPREVRNIIAPEEV